LKQRLDGGTYIFVVPTHSAERFRSVYRENADFSRRHYLLTSTNTSFNRKAEAIFDFTDDLVKILERYPEYTLLVLGIGKGFDRYRTRLEKAMANKINNIEFRHNENDMTGMYERSVLLLYFSYLDGFPSVVVEAQSAGLPVISTACCGMVEMIEDGVTGFLVEKGRGKGLVETVVTILEDRRLYKKIRREAFVETQKRYSRKKCAALFKKAVLGFLERG
jgi:glycosyltransferase involved in cell wall biosynthesis